VFGFFAVQLSGVYFAMLTLAFAQIVWSVCFPMGRGDRRRQRHPRRLAREVAAARRISTGFRSAWPHCGCGTSDHRVLALWLRAAGDARLAFAQRGHRHRRQAHSVDAFVICRHRCRCRRCAGSPISRAVSSRQPRHLALGRCAGHGAASAALKRSPARSSAANRLQGAQHLAGKSDRSVQAGAWRCHRSDRGRLPQGHRRDAGDDPEPPPN